MPINYKKYGSQMINNKKTCKQNEAVYQWTMTKLRNSLEMGYVYQTLRETVTSNIDRKE